MQYQIGDFSKISKLSIKTLHFYHECGILEPSHTDRDTGYRYYDEISLVRANIIKELKELDFTIKDIKEILTNCEDDTDLINHATTKLNQLKEKTARYLQMQKKLETFIRNAQPSEGIKMETAIIIKTVPTTLIASIRFQGKYSEVTPIFQSIYGSYGKYACGCPLSLYYDNDYKDEAADIEACVPVKTDLSLEDVKCRKLLGGKALTIIHKGSYETIGESYKLIIDHINQNHLQMQLPTREIYLKGPGIILPRSPKKFVTEIQMLFM